MLFFQAASIGNLKETKSMPMNKINYYLRKLTTYRVLLCYIEFPCYMPI